MELAKAKTKYQGKHEDLVRAAVGSVYLVEQCCRDGVVKTKSLLNTVNSRSVPTKESLAEHSTQS